MLLKKGELGDGLDWRSLDTRGWIWYWELTCCHDCQLDTGIWICFGEEWILKYEFGGIDTYSGGEDATASCFFRLRRGKNSGLALDPAGA